MVENDESREQERMDERDTRSCMGEERTCGRRQVQQSMVVSQGTTALTVEES